MKKMRHTLWVVIGALLLLPEAMLWGDGTFPETSGKFENPLNFDSLSEFLVALLKVIIEIAFPIIVLMIIFTGFLFIKAQGKPEELKSAKTALLWTLIGATLILGAFVLSQAICGTIKEIGSNVNC